MVDPEKSIRARSDEDLLAMLDDEASYTSEAIRIAFDEQERRGGRSALEESLAAKERRLRELDDHGRAVRLPLRGRIVGQLWFWMSLLALLPVLLSFDMVRITSGLAISHALRMVLAALVLRVSRIAIVLFSLLLGFSGFRLLYFVVVYKQGDLLLLLIAGFYLISAILVGSCFKAALKIHEYLGNSDGN